jgi:tripartite-type tricarboxylate transporter receptor subunit TctC
MTTTAPQPTTRRRLLALMALAPCSQLAFAQAAWPAKPVRLVVPFAAGLSIDAVARMIAEQLGRSLGQPVLVDNKPGAAGIIGTTEVARAAPDGYTLILSTTSAVSLNPHIYPKQQHPYDTLKDFVPITHTTNVPFALVTAPSQPYKDLNDLIAAAKAQPGKIDYASLGAGSAAHVLTEMLKNMAGINLVHVPYKSLFLNDIMAGTVPIAFEPLTTAVPQVRAGKLRALAVGSPKRSPALPDVAAIAELLPGFDGDAWHGIFAPAGTPNEVVNRVSADVAKIMRMPEIQRRLADLGLQPVGSTPQEFASLLKKDYDKWGEVIRKNGITLTSG